MGAVPSIVGHGARDGGGEGRRPRVLYHFRTRGAGAEGVHIAGIASALGQLGYDVSFLSPTGVNPLETKGQPPMGGRGGWKAWLVDHSPGVLFELLEILYNVVAVPKLWMRLRREQTDLFYERHAFFLCGSAWLARRTGLRVVIEVNELVGSPRVRAQPLLRWLARWTDGIAFRQSDLIVVVSPYLKRQIEESGIEGERVLVLPNAVDEESYREIPEGVRPAELAAVPDDVPLIVFVGWLVPWHGLDRLIRVVCELRGEGVDTSLLVVGDGSLRGELSELVSELGMGDRVFFSGAVSHERTRSITACADICVVPQSNEYRSPIKLFEYMAAGRAVVAPDTEPIRMVVRDGENGVLFESDSAESLAGSLRRLATSKGWRDRLGEAARCDVLEHHTWRANAERILGRLEAR